MTKSINLLPELYQETEKEKRFKRVVSKGSPIVLISYGIIILITYIYWNIQVLAAKNLSEKIAQTQKSIQDQKETESLYRGIKTKMTGVTKVLAEQVNYAKVIAHIEEITPPEAAFTNLEVKDSGIVDLAFKTPDSNTLAAFINALLDEKRGGKYFEQAKLTSLVLSREGSYLFSLNFHLKKEL